MDLSFLQPVYGHTGPFASLYLDVTKGAEDADHAIQVRWGKAREDLAEQGAGEDTLRALDEVVGNSEQQPGPRGQVVFATGSEVALDVLTRQPPQDYVARVGPLPHVMPFLARRGQHVPYVLVKVDSRGGDITAVDLAGTARGSRVEGGDHPTHKPRGGAEHHKHMQRAVDEQVKHNADEVANEVQHLAVGGGAEAIVLAGEVEARRALRAQLSEGLQDRVVETDAGSRAAGSAGSPLDSEVQETLNQQARQRVRSVVDRYEQERGHAERATEGLAATVHALQRGQVATVLWSAQNTAGSEELWVGRQAEQIGLSAQETRDIGAENPISERADAALVRAAAGTSADLVLVPEDMTSLKEGVGALLRFSDPSTPA